MALQYIDLNSNDSNYKGRIAWERIVSDRDNRISNLRLRFQLANMLPSTGLPGGRTAAYHVDAQIQLKSYATAITPGWVNISSSSVTLPNGGEWVDLFTSQSAIETIQQKIYHSKWFENPVISISVTITSTTNGHNETFTVSTDITVPSIIEPANLTFWPTKFTDEDNPTIEYTNPDGNALDALEVRIANSRFNTIIDYRGVNKTGNSYTFNFTPAERTQLLATIGNGTTATVYFQMVMRRGDESRALNLKSSTLTLANVSGPTITASIEDTKHKYITGGGLKFIRGNNEMAFSMTATGQKGATITSVAVICGNTTIRATSGTFTNIENETVIFSATDSRGRTSTETITLEPVPYIKPTCNQTVKMILQSDTEAQISLDIEGNYFNENFGKMDNYLILYVRHKRNDEDYGDWVDISPLISEISNGRYKLHADMSGFDPSGTYTFQCAAEDYLSTAVSDEYPVQFIPVFDWSKDDFNFNVPVYIEGNPLVDYVIETGQEPMGTNGTWYWSKWRSGRAECYGCRNYGNMAVSTDWGGWFRSGSFNQNLPFGLFTDTPEVIDINLRQGSSGGWVVRYENEEPTSDTTGSFIVVRPKSATISQAYISFNVVGRWK
jgi:hypothetical protein